MEAKTYQAHYQVQLPHSTLSAVFFDSVLDEGVKVRPLRGLDQSIVWVACLINLTNGGVDR